MRRPDSKLLFAFLIALAAHLLLLRAGEQEVHKDLGWWMWTQNTNLPTATASIVQPEPQEQIGEAGGLGKSINSAPGNVPMQSDFADLEQEQAMMTREKQGNGPSAQAIAQALQSQNTSQQNSKTTDNSSDQNIFADQESSLQAPPAPKSKPAPVKVAMGQNTGPSSAVPDAKAKPSNATPAEDPMSAGPAVLTPPAKVETTQQKPSPQPPSPQQPSATPPPTPPTPQQQQNGATGGAPVPSGDFESTPVSMIRANPQSGEIHARAGRKMITRELPRLGLSALGDLMTLENPTITLRIKIDKDGNVTDVETIHSSGSDDIDLPWERAVEHWWFEPKKDRVTHKPVPDVMDLDIHFE